jgi:c-di-GMP-binding flagellar brake protein YcgR
MVVGDLVRERRRFVRVASDHPVQLKQVPNNYPIQVHNAMSQDISEGGIQLSSFYFYPVHSRMAFDIFLSRDSEPVQGVGRVVWIEQLPFQERYKVGFEFSELNDDSLTHLQRVIADKFSPEEL